MQVDDPFNPSQTTVLRPRPGAGRRGGGDGAAGRAQPPFAPAPGDVPGAPPLTAIAANTGLNPLVQAAAPLLMVSGEIRTMMSMPDVAALRRYVLDELRRFEERARSAHVTNEIVLAARYVLCAALDEAVMSTPWGGQTEWTQQGLLVALHREAWGGEKFFQMLDRLSQDPAKYADLLELQYLCLALGFSGKYQVLDRGHARLAEIQHGLYRQLRNHRGTPPPELSLRWRGVEDRRNPVIRYVPLWVVAVAALATVTIAFVVFSSRLGTVAAPVQATLARIGTEDFTAPAPAVAPVGPTLKQLLAADERGGALRIEEDGSRTRITLLAPDLFASGSATINDREQTTLQHIGAALDRVPGRVLVVGHTDDQPLRSLRYRDNFDLSRERAVTVGKILQADVRNPARVEWTGVGSTEPRYQPPSTAENRARNRRVEIVHVAGA